MIGVDRGIARAHQTDGTETVVEVEGEGVATTEEAEEDATTIETGAGGTRTTRETIAIDNATKTTATPEVCLYKHT